MPYNFDNVSVKKVSRIYEKVFTPEGDGFSGFTVHHGGNEFTNHIEYFAKDNREEVTRQVAAVHADVCKACQKASEEGD